MSELIGRFLSFEDHLGRGLVKFAYYLALFFAVVTNVYFLLKALFGFHLGDAVIVICQAALWIVVLRVGAELALAILSIDDNLQQGRRTGDGFEAGLTPAAATKTTDTPQAAKPVQKDDADGDAGSDEPKA